MFLSTNTDVYSLQREGYAPLPRRYYVFTATRQCRVRDCIGTVCHLLIAGSVQQREDTLHCHAAITFSL
nr:unnamed protein product [Haemonchus contortus]